SSSVLWNESCAGSNVVPSAPTITTSTFTPCTARPAAVKFTIAFDIVPLNTGPTSQYSEGRGEPERSGFFGWRRRMGWRLGSAQAMLAVIVVAVGSFGSVPSWLREEMVRPWFGSTTSAFHSLGLA